MNILLCSTLILFIAINKAINKKILFPSVLVCLVFFLSSLLVLINQKEWDYTISRKAFLVIIISLIAFSIGTFLGSRLQLKGRWNKAFCGETLHVSGVKVAACTTVCIVVDLLYYRNRLNLSLLLGGSNALGDMFLTLRSNMKTKSDLYALSMGMNIGVAFVRAFGYICLFLLIHRIINRRRKKIIRYIIPVMCLVVCELLSSSRIGLIAIVSASIFNVYFLFKEKRINLDKKIIKYSGVAVIVFFTAFYLFGNLTGQSAVYSVQETISIYLGASIICFDNYLCAPWSKSGIVAQYSFKGINALLRRFGANIPAYSNHLPNVYFGHVGSNIYTAFFPFVHDFGITASIVIQFVLGIIFGATWKMFNRTNGIGIFSIVYGRFFGYAILMYSIAERLCSEFLALNVFVEFVFYYLIFKFLFVQKAVAGEKVNE